MRIALTALGLAAAWLAAPGAASAQELIADPWEETNRDLFAVNESIDRAVLEPVARGYRAVTPRPVRRGVVNFLRNLRAPAIFANDVLQGEVNRAGVTAGRFGVNTLIGFGGMFDPAAGMGLEFHDEDFGQTLAVWGMESGPYLFVPLLGPTSVRDATGSIVNIAFDPLTWAEFDGDDTLRVSRTLLTGVASRELVIEAVEDTRTNSLDPYVSTRTTYSLLRDSAIQNGRSPAPDLPDLSDIPDLTEASGDLPPIQPADTNAETAADAQTEQTAQGGMK